MNNFKRINTIAGWIICVLASIVYLLTIEPTTSFWDCGEFIASSYKLEVGHPPGNPVFQLLGRLFSMFVPVSYAAPMINAMSALCSGFTILFLFWSITHLTRRIMERNNEEFTTANIIAIIGAGVVGSLAYTFSDSFWFSAVEAEVYSMSSLFTAVVFWAILKWEEEANKPFANRWLALIAYLMGVSIGVHLLNLLAIPAIVFIYYFKKYKVSTKGVIFTFFLSGALVLMMMQFVPFIPTLAAYFDLFFVNSLGAPFNIGATIAILLLLGLAVYGIVYTFRKKKIFWNTVILMFTVAMIGYSSFAMIVIRSSANTPTNENQPDNPFSLLYYLNRDQYGSAPLLSGPTYATPPIGAIEKSIYIKSNGKYQKIKVMYDPKYDSRYTMFFSRMHSYQDTHKAVYKQYVNQKRRGIVIPYTQEMQPSFRENLSFFFSYQVNWMYFRYFMWNFAGRQNDIQGHGNSYYGNWECGIPFIDNARLGDMSDMPPFLAENKARNHYYLLPLILGLAGLFFQLQKDKRNFIVVMLLFVLTGVAIVVYINQTPIQPRERDYSYAGSFYAFTIWIGLGVYAIYDFLRKKIPATAAASITSVLCVLIPLQMGAVNWDDHDRSNRYTARDAAYNYLQSCDENAILFTGGDNDTFPLWYVQEVEGIRRDVRVVNLSLLGTDWYIDQMKYRMYDTDPVPFKLARENYLPGVNDFIPVHVREQLKEPQPINLVMEFLNNPRYRERTSSGELISYIPTRNILIPVNKDVLLEKGIVKEKYANNIMDTMLIKISKDDIRKPDMMILDLLANNNWERPVHFVSIGGDIRLDISNYCQYVGYTYKLMPVKQRSAATNGFIDTDDMYNKMMNVFRWDSMSKEGILIDHTNSVNLMMSIQIRNMFVRLADALIQEGKNEKAIEVLDAAMERVPEYNFPYNISVVYNDVPVMNIIQAYYKLGEIEKANTLAAKFIDLSEQNVAFFSKLNDGLDEMELNLAYLQQMSIVVTPYNEELGNHATERIDFYIRQSGYSYK
jgi:phage shock protein PspC (stress-responsive transcriptional regulator)